MALHLLDTEDIYGQMVVYLPLNGITPPATSGRNWKTWRASILLILAICRNDCAGREHRIHSIDFRDFPSVKVLA
jgi:hypothetical protein